jgi:hypothetical protein
MDTCDSLSAVYYTQLFQTLGQISAVILSGTVAVPVVTYYSRSLRQLYYDLIKQD